MTETRIHLVIPTTRLLQVLLLIELLLLDIDLWLFFGIPNPAPHLGELMDLTLEANLPTTFAALQAIAVGIGAWLVYRLRRRQGAGFWSFGWLLIALFFFYVGIDDASLLHERVGSIVGGLAQSADASNGLASAIRGWASYHWQLVFLLPFGAAGIFMLLFLRREFAGHGLTPLLLGGLACYVIAVGLDHWDAVAGGYLGLARVTGLSSADVEHLARATEELLEMMGTTLLLVAVWRFPARLVSGDPRASVLQMRLIVGATGRTAELNRGDDGPSHAQYGPIAPARPG